MSLGVEVDDHMVVFHKNRPEEEGSGRLPKRSSLTFFPRRCACDDASKARDFTSEATRSRGLYVIAHLLICGLFVRFRVLGALLPLQNLQISPTFRFAAKKEIVLPSSSLTP